MKLLQNILILCLMFLSSTTILAQKDSLALQRKARGLVRDGNKLYEQEKYTDASVAYKKALENSASYEKASYNLGNAMYQNKNYKEAVPQFELSAKTAKDKSSKAEAYHNLGNAFMETKNYQGAVDAYKNSLRNNPTDDETRYNLAVAQKNLEKEKQDQKQDPKKDDKKDPNQQQKPQKGKMSPEQIKQLLESLNNEEKKTQKKMNAEKAKGEKVKQEKDW